jgi:hypothetical protein
MTASEFTLPDPLGAINSWVSFVLAIAAALGLARGVGYWLRNTLARRWLLARKIRQLATGMRLEQFSAALGASSFGDKLQTWVFPECYVTAAVQGNVVSAYAVTTRRRFFRPVLRPTGLGRFRLGKSTLNDVCGRLGEPTGGVGARRWGYGEKIYCGNPGLYREFALAVNDAGYVYSMIAALDLARCVDELEINRTEEALTRLRDLRKRVRINTYGVSAPHASVEGLENGLAYGVDYDTVRVLDDANPLWLRGLTWLRLSYLAWRERLPQ